VDQLGGLEDGAFQVRFQDENGHWKTYNLDAELLEMLRDGIQEGSPNLDITI
jgi:hypothetical protein